MPLNAGISKIELEEEFGAVLKNVASEAEHAATAVDKYGRAARRAHRIYERPGVLPTASSPRHGQLRRQEEKTGSVALQPSIGDVITPGNVNMVAAGGADLVKEIPGYRRFGQAGSGVTSVAGSLIVAHKYLGGNTQQEFPTILKGIDRTNDALTVVNSAATLSNLAFSGAKVSRFVSASLGPIPLVTGAAVEAGMYLYNKDQARRRASKARAAEQNRTLPQYIQSGLETDSSDAGQRLGETYTALRMSNQSVANLTGMNVEDFLKVSATLNPIKLFKSLRAGKGPAGELSDAQLESLETIEKLVVTYQKLAHETVEAKEAAAEYADERARLAQLDKTSTLPSTDADPEYAARVRTAQKRLITATGSAEELQGLWERLDRSQTYKQTDEIYREISKRYGAEVQEAFRVVDVARQRLQAASEAGREISNVYTEAAAARAGLTQEERQSVQVKAEAVQVGDKQAATERALAVAQTAQGQAAKASAQAEAAQRAGRQDLAAQSRNLEKQTHQQTTATDAQVRTTQTLTKETLAAGEQMAATTRRVEDGAAAHSGLTQALRVHQERVTPLTEAYRALSGQIGETVGDVLSGEVSFKEAWESLGRGVLETVRNLGRQVVDSLLGYVRDLGRRLSDVIFGQLQGVSASFGFGGSRGFLPAFLGGGSLGGFPVGLPTFPAGGGVSFGGFPVGGGSQLLNAGAATVARYLPFTAPTLASYGFAISPVGLGIGSGAVAPGLNAGALGLTPRYAAPVPGINAPPAAGIGPFSPAALGALGGLGGGYGGTALLSALGFQPGFGSMLGGVAGGIAGSLVTPALTTALFATPLAPLAPVLGPLFGTFFGTTLGGLFGFQPTRIDTEKRGLQQFFREEVPGYHYSRKERSVGRGLSAARAAGLSVEEAYIAAGIPYALAANKGGLGTLTRFRNIGVGGLGRSGASLKQARAAALRVARATGTDTTAGAVEALNRALGGGFDRDKFTVAEVLENVQENAGETRSTRSRPVRLRDAVQGIFDIQTQFADFVDSGKLAAKVIADETAQALTAAGRDADQYADVLDRIRSGATHAAEGLREIGGLDFKDLTFTAEELDAHLIRIKDDVEAIQGAATQALTAGLSEGQSRAEVEESFQAGLQETLRRNVVKRTIDQALGDLGPILEDIDLTEPLDAGSEAALRLKEKVGDVYDVVIDTLRAAGLLPDGFNAAGDAADKIGQSLNRIAEHNRDLTQTQQLEAIGVLDPGTAQQRNLHFLQDEVAALDPLTADTPAREIRHAMTLLDQLAAATVEYYRTALAQEQQRAAAFAATGDFLDQQIQSLIGGPGGYRPTEQLAFLQDRERDLRTKLKDATGVERATYLQQLGANLTAQARLPIYDASDPRHIARRDAIIAELETLRREADTLRAQSEKKLVDLQKATATELEQIHALQDAYFAASLGKLDALVDNTARDYTPPPDPLRPGPRSDGGDTPESSQPQSSGPDRGDRPAPAVTINVTLPESADAADEAATYARAFVAELERQLQPGARGYELIHTISRESCA